MILTDAERRTLDGADGPAKRRAMEILVALGTVFDAERMVPIRSAQVAGVSYSNLGDEGLELLEEFARDGRIEVPTTLNPAGMDLRAWSEMGIPEAFAERQLRIIAAYERMGIAPSCTCTPYLAGNRPALGDHVAWSESSAVTFANSALGARTNREGGPGALAAALTGVTPLHGLHLDGPRTPCVLVRVETPLDSVSDFGALAAFVARRAPGVVPLIEGVSRAGTEELKSLSAALPTFGGASLFHVAGVTPEAHRFPRPSDGFSVRRRDLEDSYEALDDGSGPIDLVTFGCPHASIDEIRRVAARVDGLTLAAPIWVSTSRAVREEAAKEGLVERIERAGGRVVPDTCFVVAPLEGRFRSVATDSAKGCYYGRGANRFRVHLGSFDRCIMAALTAHWTSVPHPARPAGPPAEPIGSCASTAPPAAVPTDGPPRPICRGTARGFAIVSSEPVSFYGGVDPATGKVIERRHPLEGKSIAGRILVMPTGKGSTVGAYVLYRMEKLGTAPAGILCRECDPVTATGAILARIPCADRIDISVVTDGADVAIEE